MSICRAYYACKLS